MTSYDFYDLYRDPVASGRVTTFPLVGAEDENTTVATHVGRNLHWVQETGEILCHVPIIFRWSDGDLEDVSDDAFGGAAAALMAMHHFNNGINTIVEGLDKVHEQCPIRFTTELIDSQSSGTVAMQALTRLLTRRPDDVETPQPCALLGSSWSSITKKLATVTGVYDLLQVTSSASSVELDDAAEYPLFARTHPSDASMAFLSMDYLYTQLNVEYVAVLYIDNDFGKAYNSELLKYAAQYNMTMVSEGFREEASEVEIDSSLRRLKATGFRYFLGVFFSSDYERVMTRALELDIAGPETFWMFNGALASMFINGELEVVQDSPLARATFGTAILSDEGGLPGLDVYHDRFLAQWKAIAYNEELLTYINSKQPKSENLSFIRTPSYFESVAPSHIAAFSFDAVVGLGLSACKFFSEIPRTKPETVFTGEEHHAEFIQNTFHGASGEVVIGPETFSRRADSTYHVVSNILPIQGRSSTGDGIEFFSGRPWIVFDTATQSWRRYDTANEFFYSSDTTVPPQQLPPVQTDNSEISPAVRGICLSLGGLAMAMSIGFYVYCCIVHRKARVINAAQPFFLGLICMGSLILASAIIPASIDDTIASARGADVACIAQYWLFPIGFCLIFSALFSKLWRINKLIGMASTFKRIQVTPMDVIIPLVVLMGSNLAILIVWTILDPPHYEREVLEYDAYGRPTETRGYCDSEHRAAFLYPLVAVNGVALILALWQAWIGRGITTDFSESKYIAMATACIFQAIFMGVPITVIAGDDSTAFLFVFTTIILVICFSILLLIFVPKVWAIHNKDPDAPLGTMASTISIRGKKVSTRLGGSTSYRGSPSARVTMSGELVPIVDGSEQWMGPSGMSGGQMSSVADSSKNDSEQKRQMSSVADSSKNDSEQKRQMSSVADSSKNDSEQKRTSSYDVASDDDFNCE